MKYIWISQPQFEYDIHSLVKAFYPEDTIRVICPECGAGERDCSQGDGKTKEDCLLQITFEETGIVLVFREEQEEGKEHVFRAGHGRDAGRKEKKDVLKRLIYQALSRMQHQLLPWGTLTGIRPVKIPMEMLDQGMTEAEILQSMQEEYYMSEKKGLLGVEIAKKERELLASLHTENGYSLYVGIPFCPTTCLYCSFTSYPIGRWKKRVSDYLDALCLELEATAEICRDKILDTVYIGGGTPTTLEPEELDRLLKAIETHFDMSTVMEFTVEAGRADSITPEKLRVLKQHGVTRISVNPQTMKEETLRLIGRQHSVDQVREAFATARAEGFDNINMDMILGLPEETAEDVQRTMEELAKLDPDSLTVHSLAIKRASGMSQWIEENGRESLRNTEEIMELADAGARQMGMHPYYLYRQKNMSGNLENVGYAKPGKDGLYNILIMEEKQSIAACGAGSISKCVHRDGRIERCESVKDVLQYMERIDEMIERKRRLFREDRMDP